MADNHRNFVALPHNIYPESRRSVACNREVNSLIFSEVFLLLISDNNVSYHFVFTQRYGHIRQLVQYAIEFFIGLVGGSVIKVGSFFVEQGFRAVFEFSSWHNESLSLRLYA